MTIKEACPFCGSKELSTEKWDDSYCSRKVNIWMVVCAGCDCEGPTSTVSSKEAQEKWDKRAEK